MNMQSKYYNYWKLKKKYFRFLGIKLYFKS